MKRLHVHVSVDDLAQSVRFYSTLFAAEPTVLKDDYAKWMIDDPRVNFAISTSCRPAHAAGFRDRGMLREGYAADIVVYDLNGLDIEPDWTGEIAHDFPGGEWRRVQRAKGYHSIIVNGAETFHDGKCTGATPGKLLRNGHA